MSKKRYLTITEFAKASGLSRQSVYNKLDKELTQFVKVDNGRKLIDIKALDKISVKQSVNESVKVDSKVDNQLTREYIQSLQDTIEDLREQNQNLTQLLSQQQALTLNLQGKLDLLEEPEPKEQKQGFFSKIFRNK